MEYTEFIEGKTTYDYNNGFDIKLSDINNILFDWQKAIVRWGIRKGKAALFEDCGMGKTFQQIEWLRIIKDHKNLSGLHLIVCPLSVAEQTIKEGEKLGVSIKYVSHYAECFGADLYITNYERLEHFKDCDISAMVLDESSILKSVDGKTKSFILNTFRDVPYKLSCTATPSPNDISEMGNQVEFLNLMTSSEMLSKFFINDCQAGHWRLKGHAKHEFYKWMSSWSVFIRRPSDIGFSDEGYNLPKLEIHPIYVDSDFTPDGELFPTTNIKGLTGRAEVRRQTADDKINHLAEIIKESNTDQWLIWCGLNPEADKAEKEIPESKQVRGADKPNLKTEIFNRFKHLDLQNLVTKPKIAGLGMNFQQSNHMAFVGIGDSFEKYYQCIRRQYRFGQKAETVYIYIMLTNAEQGIYQNVLNKEKETAILYEEVVKEMQDFTKDELTDHDVKVMDTHKINKVEGNGWTAYEGDNVETIKMMDNESVDMQIFSPPFFSLYTYSPSPRDMGNNNNDVEFWKHFDFLIPELFRVLKPGRVCAVHCMDTPARLGKDGYIGLKDLRGDIIRHFEAHGYIYDGCAIIPKNPQAQSIRTHAKGLTFTQFEKDSSWSRPALPDYLVKFRKPGINTVPVENGDGKEITRDDWIGLADGIWTPTDNYEMKQAEWEELNSGVWTTTVRETYTLNTIKHPGDEAHMCPLQLDTIHNAVRLWSNPGELIHSPFGGIGSEGYQSIMDNRRAVMQELKPEYFNQLCKNNEEAVKKTKEGRLF